MPIHFDNGMLPETMSKGLSGFPQSSLADGTVSPKTASFHKRAKSDTSQTYSSRFIPNVERRSALPLLDSNKLSSPAESNISTKSQCSKSALFTTAVDTCIPSKPLYCRAISTGIQGCRVPAMTCSYFASLSSFTTPIYAHLDSCRSDAIPTYSIQLHSIKSRYKHAPKPHPKLPGSTVDSGISSAQSPPRLTPSASFSTPSCGTSTPSSCASSVDRVFGTASHRTPGILSVDCVRDGQPLSIAFNTGSRAIGLPPVAIAHAAGTVSNIE